MWRAVLAIVLGVTLAGVVLAHTVFAQHPPTPGSHSHDSMPGHGGDMHAQPMRAMQGMTAGVPTMPDAFGAIAEIVRILEADPTTDWAKVDLERLPVVDGGRKLAGTVAMRDLLAKGRF